MKKVFRIEHSLHGRGPYFEFFPSHFDGNTHKPMIRGGYSVGAWRGKRKGSRFGFESLAHLNNWFSPGDLKMLRKHNYHIVEFDVKRYEFNDGEQVRFNVYSAKKQATHQIGDINVY